MKTLKEIKESNKSILLYNEDGYMVLTEKNVQTDEIVMEYINKATDADIIEVFEDDEIITVVLQINTTINNKIEKRESITLKEIKKGDYFTLKEIAEPKESQVYIKGDYDRASKTFSVCKFSDMNNERFLKADKQVYTDFTF